MVLSLKTKAPAKSWRPKVQDVDGSMSQKVVLGPETAFELGNLLVEAEILANGGIKGHDGLECE